MGIKNMVTGKVAVRVLVILLMTVILFTSMATPVYAGVEPSPWRQVITLRIAAIELAGIRMENAVLLRAGVEPTPWRLNRLQAEVYQLNAIYDRINAVLSVPPEPSRVREALVDVRDRAQGIVDDIRMTDPPDPQRVRELLAQVSDAAQAIADWANRLLRTPGIG